MWGGGYMYSLYSTITTCILIKFLDLTDLGVLFNIILKTDNPVSFQLFCFQRTVLAFPATIPHT